MKSRNPFYPVASSGCGVLILVMLLAVSDGQGQDISTASLRWTSTSTVDLKTNEPSDYSCAFISSPTEIQWLQKNGQSVKHFAITGTVGSWSTISEPGTVTFQVSEGTTTGTIVFSKSATGTVVTLDFTSHQAAAIKRQFNISAVQLEP